MILSYSFHDDAGVSEAFTEAEITTNPTRKRATRTTREMPLILDKVRMPQAADVVDRPRITDFLEKSVASFGASLVSGRAITGKTYAALCLAKRYKSVAWYTIDSTDADWTVFANYLWAAVAGSSSKAELLENTTDECIAAFLSKLFSAASKRFKKDEVLIVLDDLHHVFDTEWFSTFFPLLLSSAPQNVHLLMLCRSRPAVPLWRFRSKQVLNVVDEKMLAFDTEETERLCRTLGIPEQVSRKVPISAFGRAGKVADFLRSEIYAELHDPDASNRAIHR